LFSRSCHGDERGRILKAKRKKQAADGKRGRESFTKKKKSFRGSRENKKWQLKKGS